MTKTCTKCNELKDVSEFTRNKISNDGYEYLCKQCRKLYRLKHKEHIRDYHKMYNKQRYKDNPEQYKELNRSYRIDHCEKIKEYSKIYRINNLEQERQRNKQWRENNKECVRIYRNEHALSTQKWRYTSEYKLWKQTVYERDNHTCQECNANHCKVHAHHIKPAKDYKELRFDINNGVCLCEQCHKTKHHC